MPRQETEGRDPSVHLPFFLPRFALIRADLPFIRMSFELSEGVPVHRWFGLQQTGLSHLWQTRSEESISPWANSYATRCVGRIRFPWLTVPYPFSFNAPVQGQQDSSPPERSTRLQKRSEKVDSYLARSAAGPNFRPKSNPDFTLLPPETRHRQRSLHQWRYAIARRS